MLPTPNTWDGAPPKSRLERHHHRFSSNKGGDDNLREVILYEYDKKKKATIAEYHRQNPAPSSLLPEVLYNGKRYRTKQPVPWDVDAKTGEYRLSPVFTEWIMGLPSGWITDIPGIKWFQLLGNGGAPPQVELALRSMVPEVPRLRDLLEEE